MESFKNEEVGALAEVMATGPADEVNAPYVSGCGRVEVLRGPLWVNRETHMVIGPGDFTAAELRWIADQVEAANGDAVERVPTK